MINLTMIRSIGIGGFGNVELVEDADGTQFARKTFAPKQQLGPEILENVLRRFAKEVRIQGGIKHPNIVPILASDLATNNPPSYLMPVAADSLSKDLGRDKTLDGKFISAISDIVAGLEELHSMQIFHRDLKPDNVLRFKSNESEGGEYYYATGDFALNSMRESSLSVLTRTAYRRGSDHYTAPEVVNDLRKASAQSDIYSLGCILHDMVGIEDRVPCAEIREDGEFAAIMLGCTRLDPTQRFKSARAVLDAILSVDYSSTDALPSQTSIDFIDMLGAGDPQPAEFWDSLADFLDFEAVQTDRAAICFKLDQNRIAELCGLESASANRIAISFAKWVQGASFNFEYCDGLANRLEGFFGLPDFEAKVECLMAMLEMGTSHNRWYVERKFARLCGPDMEVNLAKRLGVEFRIRESDVCRSVEYLERSIDFNRDEFHPALINALRDTCR